MAGITEAEFEKRHPRINIEATGTFPTTDQFTEWIAWSDGKICSYLQTGSTLPTDQGNIIKNISDDLLMRKYVYEKHVSKVVPGEILRIPLPELTPQNKMDLDSLKGQDDTIEAPAFNFDLDKTIGGYQD